MSRKIILLSAGVCSFFAFVLFSYFVHKNLFTGFDFNMTVRLQDHISHRFDDAFSSLSSLGSFEPMLIVLIIFIGMLVWKKQYVASSVAFIFFIGLHLIEIYGKFFVNHPPPPQFMLRTKQLINFPQFHVRAEYSYPSGHSGRTLFLSTILILLLLNGKQLPFFVRFGLIGLILVYDVTMLISRIYLGEHWTTDVIGGTFLGLALGLVTGGLLRDKRDLIKKKV